MIKPAVRKGRRRHFNLQKLVSGRGQFKFHKLVLGRGSSSFASLCWEGGKLVSRSDTKRAPAQLSWPIRSIGPLNQHAIAGDSIKPGA